MNQPRHIELVFLVAVFFSFAFISQSVADNSLKPPVFSEQEKALHQQRMQNMTAEEKARYRDEQYETLKQRAAAIGYTMPATPPWKNPSSQAAAPAPEMSSPDSLQSMHQKQLSVYRQAAAEKRKEMQEKIARQREEIQQRIDALVQKNAIQPAPPEPPAFPGYQPVPVPATPYYPAPPAYPGHYYNMSPYGYGYRY